MESLGDFLKEKRLDRNISLGQIAKATNISKKYLEALENEEFSVFPGEAYLKGFLRTYCMYLELDPEEMIKRYETIKMAESDAPIEQLIPKPKLNLRPFFIIFTFLLILGGLVFGGIKLVGYYVAKSKNAPITKEVKKDKKEKNEKKKDEPKSDTKANLFTMSEPGKKVLDLKLNDKVRIILDSQKYDVEVKQVNPVVVIKEPSGNELYLIKSYPYKLDLNNDNEFDVEFNANTWNEKTANITINYFNLEEKKLNRVKISNDFTGINPETIVTKDKIEKIDLSLEIKEGTFLRYKLDDSEEQEGFFNPENKKLNAEYRIVLWLSNAGLVNFNFRNYEKLYTPGSGGEVVVKLIEWKKNTHDEFELQVSSVK